MHAWGKRSFNAGPLRISFLTLNSPTVLTQGLEYFKCLRYAPRVIITDQLRSYGAAKRAILPSVEHRQHRYLDNHEVKPFEEYGWRFDIEANFLDDKSHGFQLESSWIRSAAALERLCLVLAITTLYLDAQGTEVVQQGKRRWVDPHWFRGQSYLKIGWHGVTLALSRGYKLVTRVH